jgi:hypothetical protein
VSAVRRTMPAVRRMAQSLGLFIIVALLAAGSLWLFGRAGEVLAAPFVSVSPSSGAAGTRVTVTGSGFPALGFGRVYWDGDATGMPTAFTSTTGAFSATLTVPSRPEGTYAVSVRVSNQEAGAPFTLTSSDPSATPAPTPSPTPTATPAATPAPTSGPSPAPPPGAPDITSPIPGSVLPGSSVTFQWSMGSGTNEYRLQVGSTQGGEQYYSRSFFFTRSATVTGLPTNGTAVYVRLSWRVSGAWQSRDYTYTAAGGSATPSATPTPTPIPSATPTPSPTPSPTPTPTPAAAQRWSDPATWNGSVPGAGAAVTIPAGKTVLLDVSPPALRSLQIDGALIFDDQDLSLSADWIIVHGRLEVGTPEQPFRKRATITLTGSDKTQNVMEMGTKVLGAMGGGRIDLHGEPRGPSWVRLNQNAVAGTRQIVLDRAVEWRVGDRIVIASTDFDQEQAEEAVISAIAGTTVTLESPLRSLHWGSIHSIAGGQVDQRAEVGLLSRNVVVQGSADSTSTRFGGHTMVHTSGRLRISGVEFARMGQTGLLGRYPVHFHLLGDAPDSYIKNSSIHHSFNRCIAIHGTHRLLVQSVVAYDTLGHCYFIEDGIETKNVLESNLGLLTRRPAEADRLIPSDNLPATYWITNPDNVLRGNVAAGSASFGFWYGLPEHPTGLSKSAQNDATVWPRRTPLGEFSGNVAHSNGDTGLIVDGGSQPDSQFVNAYYDPRTNPIPPASGQTDSAPKPAQFQRLIGYKNRVHAVWMRGLNLDLTDAILADNTIGVTFPANEVRVKNSLIVGETPNLGTPAAGAPTGSDGRSLPLPAEPSFPIRGFEFYDGRVGVEGTTFANFQPTSQREASALSHFRKNPFPIDPRNYASGLTFVNAKPVFQEGPDPGADGDKSAIFIDATGSVSGTSGAKVVTNNPFLLTSACTFRSEWNMHICQAPYSWFQIESKGEGAPGIGNTVIRREENGSTQTLVGFANAGNERTFLHTNLLPRRQYSIAFPAATPPRLHLVFRQHDADDWIRLSFPAPATGPYIYRDSSTQPLPAAISLALMDSSAGDSYYLDRRDGRLYVKLVVKSQYSEWATLDVCATPGCQ